jgi:hypothetical protein
MLVYQRVMVRISNKCDLGVSDGVSGESGTLFSEAGEHVQIS